MEFARPDHSRRQVRKAGEILAQAEAAVDWDDIDSVRAHFRDLHERSVADAIFQNWRASHAYPLNTFQIALRNLAQRIDAEAFTGQRLKRAPSIIAKLRRFTGMDLARMQDIAGCRAVVRDTQAVYALASAIEGRRHKHELDQVHDYIARPKDDGYRSYHLVYKYVGRGAGSDYDGLRVEIQIRTQIQHAWATAVETVGLFRNEQLKAGAGDATWMRFFAMASEAFAHYEQGWEIYESFSLPKDFAGELAFLTEQLDVFPRLQHYSKAVTEVLGDEGAAINLLRLDLRRNHLIVTGYSGRQRRQAEQDYAAAEKELGGGGDVVLVSVASAQALRRAFPNYFADTTLFLDTLRIVLDWEERGEIQPWLKDFMEREQADDEWPSDEPD